MDGLECTEVQFCSALSATDYFRLESEFFNAKSLLYPQILRGNDIISEVQYGTSKYCDEERDGYPVLRLNELHNGFIEIPQKYCHILSPDEFEKLRLKRGDVLIIRTNGNPNLVGQAAVVLEDTEFAFASYLFRVVPNNKINSETLVAYLNCKYGRYEIDKNSMKGNQTNFSPAKFKDIAIPKFGRPFQIAIQKLFGDAYTLRNNANRIYARAKTVLNVAMGISTTHVNEVSVKSLSASFKKTGRLDAEYYQPKYEKYVKVLNTRDTVFSLCKMHDENFEPIGREHYPYIELANVGTEGEIANVETILGNELPTRARRKVKAGQVIISSIEGSLQSCALIQPEYEGALCSTGFYVLSSDFINPETLLVLFKSEPIQALMKQRCSGTILTGITKDEFLSMPFPKIADEAQEQIASMVRQAFSLRRRSEQLLDYAKQAVELAIEQGEDVAVAWLKDKVE